MAAATPFPISIDDARALIGVGSDATPEAITAAFRRRIKAARPERGGEDTLYRELIAARAVLRSDPTPGVVPATRITPIPYLPVLPISPLLAVRGGDVRTTLDGRALSVRLPPGVRTGDRVRLRRRNGSAGPLLTALIRAEDGLSVFGDDLYMAWAASPRLIEDGGRLEIETHAGPRSVWVVRDQPTLRFRLAGLGLPARGKRPCGHLFVTLKPSAQAASEAEDRLARFTRIWTPDRLAA